jgi:hypothetical protein
MNIVPRKKAGTLKYSFVLTEVTFQQISDKLKSNASEKRATGRQIAGKQQANSRQQADN